MFNGDDHVNDADDFVFNDDVGGDDDLDYEYIYFGCDADDDNDFT